MLRGWQIGRLSGIPLAIPPLFLLWTAFLWWSLKWAFPRSHIGFPEGTYRNLALGTTCLVLASILIHEWLTIALTRVLGASAPSRVVLGPCGGWVHDTPASTEPAAVRAEILAAFCGPAVYMGIALVCLTTGAVLEPGVPDFLPTRAVLDTVAIANSSLAVLNLLPGAPLDAGRVVSAVIRRSTGDAARASRVARFGGMLVGLWLCALGIAGLAVVNSLWALWGVILGVAILEGAQLVACNEPPAAPGGPTGEDGSWSR